MSSVSRRSADRLAITESAMALGNPLTAGILSPELERLTDKAIEEMAQEWHKGKRTPTEAWLARHSELAAEPQAALRLILEEVCLREELGETVPSSEIYGRFPQWKPALAIVLDCHRLLETPPPRVVFPEPGSRLGELELLSELGRGGMGRVFLASQPSLSDRLLVVKITPRTSDEHLSLARLQHTHIAPLYLVQDFPEENLRALCMPFLGGASWSRVLQGLKGQPLSSRTGRSIVEVLAQFEQPGTLPGQASTPALRFLERATYVEAVCWIGSCLADALRYAHQCGLVHLDVKPSNVLVAGDGEPMLLDFHLAREAAPEGCRILDRLGGTPGYMSPEQERALEAVQRGAPLPTALDGRSDIYSLGIFLYESLSGQLPPKEEAASRAILRRSGANVSRGLEDLIHKCLASKPSERYADAGFLAVDLRRHLAALPLQGVSNRSLSERFNKWRRRKPHALISLLIGLLAMLVGGSFVYLFQRERLREARSAYAQAQQDLDDRQYNAAIEQLETGLNATRWLPWQAELQQSLKNRLELAKRARLTQTLATVVEQLRFADSMQEVSEPELKRLDAACRDIWQARSAIVAFEKDQTSATIVARLSTELLDLAMLWARVQVRLGNNDSQARVTQILDEAEALFGSRDILSFARRAYAPGHPDQLGLAYDARDMQTGWQRLAVGRLLYQNDELAAAEEQFAAAIRLDPAAFWPNFYLTLCTYRQGKFAEALQSAYACVALQPTRPECFYNRALCEQSLGNSEKALADFDTALQLGANPAEIYFQQALVHVFQHQKSAAMKALQQALSHTQNYAPALDLMKTLDAAK